MKKYSSLRSFCEVNSRCALNKDTSKFPDYFGKKVVRVMERSASHKESYCSSVFLCWLKQCCILPHYIPTCEQSCGIRGKNLAIVLTTPLFQPVTPIPSASILSIIILRTSYQRSNNLFTRSLPKSSSSYFLQYYEQAMIKCIWVDVDEDYTWPLLVRMKKRGE